MENNVFQRYLDEIKASDSIADLEYVLKALTEIKGTNKLERSRKRVFRYIKD